MYPKYIFICLNTCFKSKINISENTCSTWGEKTSLPWYDVVTIKNGAMKIRNKAIAVRKLARLIFDALQSGDYKVTMMYIDTIETQLKDMLEYCGDMRNLLIKNGVIGNEGKN